MPQAREVAAFCWWSEYTEIPGELIENQITCDFRKILRCDTMAPKAPVRLLLPTPKSEISVRKDVAGKTCGSPDEDHVLCTVKALAGNNGMRVVVDKNRSACLPNDALRRCARFGQDGRPGSETVSIRCEDVDRVSLH